VYEDGGTVFVQLRVRASVERDLTERIKTIAGSVEGVGDVRVGTKWLAPYTGPGRRCTWLRTLPPRKTIDEEALICTGEY
jgi:hypothetical protein